MEIERPSFAPQIDPISSEIVKQSQSTKEIKRWEHLYELGGKQKVELEEKRKQFEEAREKKEHCTFHPQLVSQKKGKEESKVLSTTGITKNEVCSIPERANQWVKSKESKIKALKEKEEQDAMGECTFKPYLAASNASHMTVNSKVAGELTPTLDANIASMKSVEKYIEKQKALRDVREESKKKSELYAGSGMRVCLSYKAIYGARELLCQKRPILHHSLRWSRSKLCLKYF